MNEEQKISRDAHFYETGNTTPPKSRVLFVFFLMLLIFIGGMISALGVLNVRLWRTFTPKEDSAVSLRFIREETSVASQLATPQPTFPTLRGSLGITAETVSPFMQAFYNLPKGVYIPRVPNDSHADAAGILPGDILLAIDEHPITDTETLDSLLQQYRAGDVVTLTLFRDGEKLSVELTLIKEK